MTNKEMKIKQALTNMYDDELIEMWNTYCEESCLPDDVIIENEPSTLNKLYEWGNAEGAVAGFLADMGEWQLGDEYISFDGYGKFNSFNAVWTDKYSPFSVDELVEWLAEDGNYLLEEYDIEIEED